MKPNRFADQCAILQGKLPRAPDWPAKSWWVLRKGGTEIILDCAGEWIVDVSHQFRQFKGRRLVDLLHWIGTMDGNLKVFMATDTK